MFLKLTLTVCLINFASNNFSTLLKYSKTFADINDIQESENATLIVFNLYYREKTSAGRKEELQRIFNISDFNNIRKISNVSIR